MPVYWLDEKDHRFPHPNLAEPGGLLAVGGDLDAERLVAAYQNGIFPWFEEEEVLYWYAPDPRFVLYPHELKVYKSMRAIFNQQKFQITLDTCFERVMRACAAAPREGVEGSWISERFIEGYTALHQLGLAHSVEVWQDKTLVGGLYGLSLGRIFYGESMFAEVSNASKAGFITLVRALEKAGFKLVDCQQETPHLKSLGGRPIPRETFMEYLEQNIFEKTLIGKWRLSESAGIEIVA
jgi:leucyl/phenylalanyl-tRNA--protein transferase